MRLFAWSGIRGSHHRATALRFLTRLHLPSFLIVYIDEFPRIPRVQRVRDAGAIAMIHIAADTSSPYAGLVSIRLQQGRSKWNASLEMYAGAFRRLSYSTGPVADIRTIAWQQRAPDRAARASTQAAELDRREGRLRATIATPLLDCKVTARLAPPAG